MPTRLAGAGDARDDERACTLFELLTGQTPFSGPPALQLFLHQNQAPAALRAMKPGLSRGTLSRLLLTTKYDLALLIERIGA